MTIKLEVGKTYKARCGAFHKIIIDDIENTDEFSNNRFRDEYGIGWSIFGKYTRSQKSSGFDLIEEVPNKNDIELRAGYLYKNRKGEKIYIIIDRLLADGSDKYSYFRFLDENGWGYRHDGAYHNNETEFSKDLIEEIGIFEENNGRFSEDIEVSSDQFKLSEFEKERKLIAFQVMKLISGIVFFGLPNRNNVIIDTSCKIVDKILGMRNIK